MNPLIMQVVVNNNIRQGQILILHVLTVFLTFFHTFRVLTSTKRNSRII